ncbi:PREDICTED: ankyrin-3-like, partial [Amphimedon queenslandica]|uniref:ANK_REP_REGION domain-containing protein n=2 Tax=Amphimedon queenslandica TaxID=400682 RepID=A0AAN0IUI2_AMPQE
PSRFFPSYFFFSGAPLCEEGRPAMAEGIGGDDKAQATPMISLTGGTPKMNLQQAVRDGREEVLRQWLGQLTVKKKKKMLINAYDSFGFTAMHYAARFNRFKMMQLLIANDANPEVRTEEGLTPLHYAARYTPLHSKTGGENEEDSAAPVTLRSTSKQILQVLIAVCHVDINVKDQDDLTPLHLACMRGNRVA